MQIDKFEWNFIENLNEDDHKGRFLDPLLNSIYNKNIIPLYDLSLKFTDNSWDLSKISHKRVPRRKSEFKFDGLTEEFNIFCKVYVLQKFLNREGKVQSIHVYLSEIKKFFCFLQSNEIYEVEDINSSHIIAFLNTLSDYVVSTIEAYMRAILDFFEIYSLHVMELEWKNIREILVSMDIAEQIGTKKNSKTSTINKKYFTSLLNTAINVMEDTNKEIYYRATACIIILLAHTGLRNSELRDMPITALHEDTNNQYNVPYFDYVTTKNSRTDLGERVIQCTATPKASMAFNTLLEIYSDTRNRKNSYLLIVPKRCSTLPLTDTAFDRMIMYFCLKYCDDIGCVNITHSPEDLKYIPYKTIKRIGILTYIEKFKENDTISIPRPHQFRVFLINLLYEKGVSLFYIQKHMGHLYREATEGYLRLEKEKEHTSEFAKKTVKLTLTDEVNFTEKNHTSLKTEIDTFIKEVPENIYKDFDAIVNSTIDRFPIRAKSGGVCIKGGKVRERRCESITDELYCTYGMCPNNYLVYFMVDESYREYQLLKKTIKHNKDNGFVKAYKKEKNKLHWLINKRLLPELNDLKQEIEKKGSDSIVSLHPKLEDIVEDIDNIYEEIQAWIQ